MAHESDEPTEVTEEPHARLDPETRARRDAALKLVRKYGDPVLKSRALEIDRFDDALRDEVAAHGRSSCTTRSASVSRRPRWASCTACSCTAWSPRPRSPRS